MRNVARLLIAVAVAVAFVTPADAQNRQRQGQGRQGGGMGGFRLNAYSMLVAQQGFGQDSTLDVNKALKDELKITDDQKDKLIDVVKPIRAKQMESMQGINFREMTDEQRKELREKGEKFAAETKKAIEGVLKPEQTKRLSQINYQLMGVQAFTNKDVETALKITDSQKDPIKAIVDEYNKDSAELRPMFGRGQQGNAEEAQKRREENQKKLAALTKEAQEKIDGKLTDEQKKLWTDMVGAKFDTTKLMQRPMRRQDN